MRLGILLQFLGVALLLLPIQDLIAQPTGYPLKNRGIIMREYGFTSDPYELDDSSFFFGLQLQAKTSEPVLATGAGVVESVTWIENAWTVVVKHSEGYTTRYENLGRVTIKTGLQVVAGRVIGYLASQGRNKPPPRLIYYVLWNGEPLNPMDYLTR